LARDVLLRGTQGAVPSWSVVVAAIILTPAASKPWRSRRFGGTA